MTTTTTRVDGAKAAAAAAVRNAIETDGRDQQVIAASARMSAAQLSRLATGKRTLTFGAARQLERAMPHLMPGDLGEFATAIHDANLDERSRSANPGLLRCLRLPDFRRHSDYRPPPDLPTTGRGKGRHDADN